MLGTELNHQACFARAYSAKGFPRRQGYGRQVEGRGGLRGTSERGSTPIRKLGALRPCLQPSDAPREASEAWRGAARD